MNYLLFNGALLLAVLAAVILYYTGLALLLSPLALTGKTREPSRWVTLPIWGLSWIFQALLGGLWAACCVALTLKFAQGMRAAPDWLYWLTGFLGCVSLAGVLAYKNIKYCRSIEGIRGVQKGWVAFSSAVVVSFSVLSFNPANSLKACGLVVRSLGLVKAEAFGSLKLSKADVMAADLAHAGTRKTVNHFLAGYDFFVRASRTVGELAYERLPRGDVEKAKCWLVQSKQRLAECDLDLLNAVHSGWGDAVSRHLMPSIDFRLSVIQYTGSRGDLARSDLMMAEFDQWLRRNWPQIVLSLKRKRSPDPKGTAF